ncbi:MAG TPA: carboxypeptidase-like regulatory domain-containing protein, partial [Planctomycetota bacterium]|nr:carboxypeptidase-like regulatory domain-containing protein [Planctomycetota bacterium]
LGGAAGHIPRRLGPSPPAQHGPLVLLPATSFEGIIRREDGTPVPAASLEMTPIGHPDLEPSKQKSGADGAFRFQNLSSGRYDLVITHENLATARDLNLTVPEAGLVQDYTMSEGAQLLIKVMAVGSTQGVSSAILSIREETQGPSHGHLVRSRGPYVTDSDGAVRLSRLAPGSISILARARGFGASLVTAEASPSLGEQIVNVYLPKERTAKLLVRNSDALPSSEALLVIKSLDTDVETWNVLASFLLDTEPLQDDVGKQWPSLRTDRRGQADLRGLPPFGRLEIRALDGEQRQAPSDPLVLDLTKTLSDETHVLTLHEGRTLTGRVESESGQAIPYAVVTCAGVRTETDGRGNFHLSAAPLAETTVAADHAGYQRALQIIPAGEHAPLLLRMKRGAWIEGVVTDERGLPIYGAFITVLLPNNQRRVSQTDFLGQFEIGNLLPKSADVAINAIGYEPQVIQRVEMTGAPLRVTLVREPLTLGASLRFRVVDARTGVALPNARVTMPSARQMESTAGRWWIKNLTPGVHALSIEADRYELRHLGDLILGPGMDLDLQDVPLRAFGTATFLLQTRGEILREVELRFELQSDGGQVLSNNKPTRGQIDGKPTYRFDRLPEGSYRIIVSQRDLRVDQAFTVPTESRAPIPLLLLPW